MNAYSFPFACLIIIGGLSQGFSQTQRTLDIEVRCHITSPIGSPEKSGEFTGTLTNNDSDLTGLTLRVYLVQSTMGGDPAAVGSGPNSTTDNSRHCTFSVAKTYTQQNISIGSTQSADLPIGTVALGTKKDSDKDKTGGGNFKYEGYFAEVIEKDQVVFTKASIENVHLIAAVKEAMTKEGVKSPFPDSSSDSPQ